MKKNFFRFGYFLVVLAIFFFGCRHDSIPRLTNTTVEEYSEPPLEDDGYYAQAEVELKQRLIDIARVGEWQTSETAIKKALTEFFNTEIKKRVNASNTLNLTIKKEYTVPVQPINNPNRPKSIKECNSFEFIVYSMDAGPFKGHAITSTDKRIGNILALVESEYQEDISGCEFALDFQDGLSVYIQHVANLWNSITDEDLMSPATAQVRTPPIYVSDPTYKFHDWVKHDGNDKYILKTKWDQNPEPFNSCIVSMLEEDDIPAGCTTVQVAQILIFHRYSKYTTSPYLAKIKRKWVDAKDWDGKYDWDILAKDETPSTNSRDAVQLQVGAFLYDIAKGCSAWFSKEGTGVLNINRNFYLWKCGYTCKSRSGYSFNKIKESIDAGYPVPITGTAKEYNGNMPKYVGHSFIVDGYFKMSCVAKKDGAEDIPITADFVHCNVGWGGRQDGYYLSGIFAMDRGALLEDYYENWNVEGSAIKKKYFSLFLRQINMLRPKGR